MNTKLLSKRYEGTLNTMIGRNEFLKEAGILSLKDVGNENSVIRINTGKTFSFQFLIGDGKQKQAGLFEIDFTEEANDYGEYRIRAVVGLGNYRTEEEAKEELAEAKIMEAMKEEVCGFCEWDVEKVYEKTSEQIAEEIVDEFLETKQAAESYFVAERLKYFINSLSQSKYELLFEYYNEGTLLSHAEELGKKAAEFYTREREKMIPIWAKEENVSKEELQSDTGLMNNLNMIVLRQALDYYVYV